MQKQEGAHPSNCDSVVHYEISVQMPVLIDWTITIVILLMPRECTSTKCSMRQRRDEIFMTMSLRFRLTRRDRMRYCNVYRRDPSTLRCHPGHCGICRGTFRSSEKHQPSKRSGVIRKSSRTYLASTAPEAVCTWFFHLVGSLP